MKKVVVKKLNDILNLKNIRCIQCNSFIDFNNGDSNELYGITDLNSFNCTCGLSKNNLDEVAYATSKFGERVHLSSYLNSLDIADITEDNIDYLYKKLDDIDLTLQDRTKSSKDLVESPDVSIEDSLNDFDHLLKASFEESGFNIDEAIARIVVCDELKGDELSYVLIENHWLDYSFSWEVSPVEVKFLNGYTVTANHNMKDSLIAFDVYFNGEHCESFVFSIKRLLRFIVNEEGKACVIPEITALTLLATNLIRRVAGIPEIQYTRPRFNLKNIANAVHRKVLSGSIVIFGQDEQISDWSLDTVDLNWFQLINSKGSSITFTLKYESENFIMLDSKAISVGSKFSSSYASYLVDKHSNYIFACDSDCNIVLDFDFLAAAQSAIEQFKYTMKNYDYPILSGIINDLECHIKDTFEYLSDLLTEDEIKEIKNIDYFLSTGIPFIKNTIASTDVSFIDLKVLIDLINTEAAFHRVYEFGNIKEMHKHIEKPISNDIDARFDKLVKDYTLPTVTQMIKSSYSEEDAYHLFDWLGINYPDEDFEDDDYIEEDMNPSMKELLDEFDEVFIEFAKEEGVPLDEVYKRVNAIEEIVSKDFEQPNLLSDDWEPLYLPDFTIGDFSHAAFINFQESLAFVDIAFGEHVGFYVAAFDLKKLFRFFDPCSNNIDFRLESIAFSLVIANLIRRINHLPEIEYPCSSFNIDTLANNVYKQVISKELTLFEQDTLNSDWTIDSVSSDNFIFSNSRNSKIIAELSYESKNFAILSTETITTDSQFAGAHASYIVDKHSCRIIMLHTEFNPLLLFGDLSCAKKGIDAFCNLISVDKYNKFPILIERLNRQIEELTFMLSGFFSLDEISEIEKLDYLKPNHEPPVMEEEFIDKEEYSELQDMVDILEVVSTLWSLSVSDSKYEYYKPYIELFDQDKIDALNKLIEKHTLSGVVAMIKNSFSSDKSDYILDCLDIYEEELC